MTRYRSAVLLALLTVVAYWPALRSGFIWDDDLYVTHNPTLRSAQGLYDIWFKLGATPQYYPLTFTTFWVEYRLWGLNPTGYHAVNILLHALNAILLWFVLQRLTVPAAWWAAAIFALHPVHVESVAWITERKNVLSGVFYLLAALVFLRGSGGRRWALAVLGLFWLALLSKTVTCTLPAALVLVLWWKRGRVEKREWCLLVSMFLSAAVAAATTAWFEEHHAKADWEFSVVERCLIAGRALWFYAGKLVWPAKLTFIYPRWELDTGSCWQYLPPVTAVVAICGLWFARKRIGRSPFAATAFFVVTLSPALGFVNVYPFLYSFVADHFQYLASIGLIALVAASIRRPVVLGSLVLMLGCVASFQTGVYRDLETLWRDTVEKNPSAWMAHHNLGGLLAQRGQTEEAIAEYSAALQVNPNLAETRHNLGEALLAKGAVEPAMIEFQTAARLDPTLAEPHHRLGVTLAATGRFREAVNEYAIALRLDRNVPQVHVDLGNALYELDQIPEAISAYRSALLLNPELVEAHYNLGAALLADGQTNKAVVQFETTLRLNPQYVPAQQLIERLKNSR